MKNVEDSHIEQHLRALLLDLPTNQRQVLIEACKKASPTSDLIWKTGGGYNPEDDTVFSNLTVMLSSFGHFEEGADAEQIMDAYLNHSDDEALQRIWQEIKDFNKHSLAWSRKLRVAFCDQLPTGQFVLDVRLEGKATPDAA